MPATTQDEPKPENRSSIKLRTSPGTQMNFKERRKQGEDEMETERNKKEVLEI